MSVVKFYSFGKSPTYPDCGITLAAAGPMKPGVDDENRARVFRSLAIPPDTVLAVKQIHSRIVHIADSAASFIGFPQGDGILTRNPDLVPSVTIADCMPIWLFDPVTGGKLGLRQTTTAGLSNIAATVANLAGLEKHTSWDESLLVVK